MKEYYSYLKESMIEAKSFDGRKTPLKFMENKASRSISMNKSVSSAAQNKEVKEVVLDKEPQKPFSPSQIAQYKQHVFDSYDSISIEKIMEFVKKPRDSQTPTKLNCICI